ncbi:MAG TPA: NADH-quinone oxidoreductase subunit M [Deinococcales bacterium]|nr:NADH-quinone oxidoreductase subunit M [Deinococcales bacterium]
MATLALGCLIWARGLPVAERVAWLPGLGVNYSVQLDGPSLLLALVTAFMTVIGLWYAATRQGATQRAGFLSMVLAMETGLLGIFAARDLVLFYVFFEGTLIPSLFLLGRYGREGRIGAALRFAVYTVIGGLIMLAAILGTRYLSGAPSFELSDLLARRLPLGDQRWLLMGFVVAFAIKLPIFPLHAWLPSFHEQNHPSGVNDLMGTLYKVGGYGLFRFALPLFPDAALELRGWLMALAAITAVGAAWIAFSQKDWKRLLAYGSLSHMGLVALGMFSLNPVAMTGALYLLAFQGVYTGALFLGVGMLEERASRHLEAEEAAVQPAAPVKAGKGKAARAPKEVRESREERNALTIGAMQGLAASAPALAGVTLILWFASIGVPGLAGFIGEFSIFIGAYQVPWWGPWLTFIALGATIAAGAYALTAYQKQFQGPRSAAMRPRLDVRRREWPVLGLTLAVIVLFGVYSAPALRLIQPGVEAATARFNLPAVTTTTGVR